MISTEDLKYCLDKGIINLPDIQSIIEMEKKKELLAKHLYQPWQGKNGSWYVYLPDNRRQTTLQPPYFY